MAQVWAPTVDAVGSLLFARTKDSNGAEVGTFNANTRPTDVQATNLINQAADDVADAVGQATGVTELPADLNDNAAAVAALSAAMLIEAAFYPEQIGTGNSPYDRYEKMYNDRLARLITAAQKEGADTTETEYMHPAGAFGGNPEPIRWWTPWHHRPRRKTFDTCCWLTSRVRPIEDCE